MLQFRLKFYSVTDLQSDDTFALCWLSNSDFDQRHLECEYEFNIIAMNNPSENRTVAM